MHPFRATPNKVLIRQTALCDWLDLSRSGLDKLRKKDPTFPKPIKDGDAQQAAVHYVVAELNAWLQSKIEVRDAPDLQKTHTRKHAQERPRSPNDATQALGEKPMMTPSTASEIANS